MSRRSNAVRQDFSDQLEDFSLSVVPLFVSVLNKAANDDVVKPHLTLVRNIEETRQRISVAVPDSLMVDEVVQPIELAAGNLVDVAMLLPDSDQLDVAKAVQYRILAIREQLQFLFDLFEFQKARFIERITEGKAFEPLAREEFLSTHEQYRSESVVFRRRLREVYDADYEDLIIAMGMPVLHSNDSLEEKKTKLSKELWRVYNRKNDLPADNRKYFRGTTLPFARELVYYLRNYEKIYGSFAHSLDQEILGKKNLDFDREVKELDGMLVCEILESSLESGKIPEDIDPQQSVAVKKALVDDLRQVIDRYTLTVKLEDKGGVSGNPFVWEILLIKSKYFSKYGLKVCDIWLDEETLGYLTNHRVKFIEIDLKKTFFGDHGLSHMSKAPAYKIIHPEEKEFFETATRAELIAYIRENLVDESFAVATKPTREGMIEVLSKFVDNGISVAPKSSHLVRPKAPAAKFAIKNLCAKAEFFRRHPEIPFYMRQVIYGAIKTIVGDLERKIVYFEAAGVAVEYYVHFLHLPYHIESLDIAVRAMKHAEKSINIIDRFCENQIVARVADAGLSNEETAARAIIGIVSDHVDSDSLPTVSEVRGLVRQGLSVEKVLDRVASLKAGNLPVTIEVTEVDYHAVLMKRRVARNVERNVMVLRELESLGHPFESFSPNVREFGPRTILTRVKLLISLFGEVPAKSMVGYPGSRIRDLARKRIKRREEIATACEELEALVAERDLGEIPDYVAKYEPLKILACIREIEDRGVKFSKDCWWWINASRTARDAQIEYAWRRDSRPLRLAELAEIYHFEVKDLPQYIVAKDPDTMRLYCKVIAAIDGDVRACCHSINQFNPIRFREKIATRIVRKGEEATEKECGWLEIYQKTEKIKAFVGDEYRGAAVDYLVDEVESLELETLDRAISKDDRVALLGILDLFFIRFKKREELEAKLRRARLGYVAMEYFGASEARMDRALDVIEYLGKIGEPVTLERLHDEEIDELDLDADVVKLTESQSKVFTYLNNLGCFSPWALKLATMNIDLLVMREKVDCFKDFRLDPEDCGKIVLDLSDFEPYLDRPIEYCRRHAIRAIRISLASKYAKERLAEALGMAWDHEIGWRASRTGAVATWNRYVELANDELLAKFTEFHPELALCYSRSALDTMRRFIHDVNAILIVRQFDVTKRDQCIEIAIRILDKISRMICFEVQVSVVNRASEIMLSGELDEFFESFGRAAEKDFSTENMVETEAMKIYDTAITSLGAALDFDRTGLLSRDQEAVLGVRKDAGDLEANHTLVLKNLSLVEHVARRYAPYAPKIPLSDLVQEGNIGLMAAVDRWEFQRGFKFSTYAFWWIRQLICRYIANHARTVRLPVYLQQSARTFDKMRGEYFRKNGIWPSDEVMVEFLGISLKEVLSMRRKSERLHVPEHSLDRKLQTDGSDGGELMDTVPVTDNNLANVAVLIDRQIFLAKVKESFFASFRQRNKERAWEVFVNRFGFTEDGSTLTLDDLGRRFGCSRENIRCIEELVVEFLRRKPGLMAMLRDLVS